MNDLVALSTITIEDALNCMKPYQKAAFLQLIPLYGEEESAKRWISSSGPDGLDKFGGSMGSRKPFWDNLVLEFRMFVCGHEKYEADRLKLKALADQHLKTVVLSISGAIALAIGVATALVVPAVSLLCYLAAKMGVNAWCETGLTG
jgi:hypothetical protein